MELGELLLSRLAAGRPTVVVHTGYDRVGSAEEYLRRKALAAGDRARARKRFWREAAINAAIAAALIAVVVAVVASGRAEDFAFAVAEFLADMLP